MYRKSRSLDAFMESRRQLIFNAASDEEIMGFVLPYTYDQLRLDEGKAVYNEADAAVEKQKLDYVKQFEAREAFEKAFNEANAVYIEHISLMRLALTGNPTKRTMLAIDGKRSQSLAGWLRQTNRFYNNAIDNDEVLVPVAQYGITNEKLIEGRDLVKQVEIANDVHDKAKGAAQQSTIDRNKALKKLDRWASAFLKVCRFALKDKPQLLEKLGILVYSEGYTKKKEEEPVEENPEVNEPDVRA